MLRNSEANRGGGPKNVGKMRTGSGERACWFSYSLIFLFRLLDGFDPPPRVLHLVERGLMNRAPLRVEVSFERAEACAEFLVGLAERRLRFDSELAREVCDREQQVAHFFFGAR